MIIMTEWILHLNELIELLLELDELEVRQRGEKPRNRNYYEIIVPEYDDLLFKKHFRMSRVIFEIINFIQLQVCLKINFNI